ncbi:MAG: DUF1566 domain-containing protein [Deltaproteobacteria bacterium]|nr:DUF1566 domain-containing protein [Deltaproteobacteria bacterium]
MKRRARRSVAVVLGVVALGWLARDGRTDAPPGRYTVTAETVHDGVTKLTWQRHPSAQLVAWSDAAAACGKLSTEGTGWRMPSISELESLVDRSRYNWALDPAAFPRPQSPLEDRFWSATPSAGTPGSGWQVDFYHGNSNTQSKATKLYLRCVR